MEDFGSRAAVLRRREPTCFSSANDNEVGRDQARSARSDRSEWSNQTGRSAAVGELYFSIFALGADQLYEVDRLDLTESAVVDVTRLAIKKIKEIFMQEFTTSVRLGRECAASEF
jgi:hypothetical protein